MYIIHIYHVHATLYEIVSNSIDSCYDVVYHHEGRMTYIIYLSGVVGGLYGGRRRGARGVERGRTCSGGGLFEGDSERF